VSRRIGLIVQAGGRGTRMGRLTANKPKALTPLRGKPLLFHTLDLFPEAQVVVIGDYRIDVLRGYCEAFSNHTDLSIIEADGTGTCAGIARAAALLDPELPALVTWSDLLYSDSPEERFASTDGIAVGLSAGAFPCRWSLQGGRPVRTPSSTDGIAGCFWFARASMLEPTPSSGEFCAYLASLPAAELEGVPIGDICTEVGTLDAYEITATEDFTSRPFNRITALADGTLLKEPVDEQGEALAELEEAWYRRVAQAGLDCVPAIFDYGPLRMELVRGDEPYRLRSSEQHLEKILDGLRGLHQAFPEVPADLASLDQAYLGKTTERLQVVTRLIPFADQPEITVNGRPRPNPLHRWDELTEVLRRNYPDAFHFIHGDPTFSNMLITDGRVVFIDPRGYFGMTRMFGDAAYDWAKLLYSLLTNYDQFNRGRFELSIESDCVSLDIESSGWEHLAPVAVAASGLSEDYLMTILGIIWLSLTTYAWDDYDKVCGAFYKGVEVLAKLWE
jgi:hypothetical protein